MTNYLYFPQSLIISLEENIASIVGTLLKLITSRKVHKFSKYYLLWKKLLMNLRVFLGVPQQTMFLALGIQNKSVSIPALKEFTSSRVWWEGWLTYTETNK